MKNIIIKILVVLVVVSLVIGIYILKQNSLSKNVINNDTFLTDKKAVKMINFVAPNCSACTKMQGLMNEIISEYDGKAQIYQIDIMENEDLAAKYNIIYTPTQIFFDEEGDEITRHEGFIGKKELVEKLSKLGVEK